MRVDPQTLVNALVQAGGYAVLCWFLIRQTERQTEAHREEVAKLSEVIRGNTEAIAALTGRVQAQTPNQ